MRKVIDQYTKEKTKGFSQAGEKSLTKQSFKQECDLNHILKRYQKTGSLPALVNTNPVYGEFDTSYTLIEAHNIMERAQAQFDALPANLRKRFNNNPEHFLAFVEDVNNKDEVQSLLTGVSVEEIKRAREKPLQVPQGEPKKD